MPSRKFSFVFLAAAILILIGAGCSGKKDLTPAGSNPKPPPQVRVIPGATGTLEAAAEATQSVTQTATLTPSGGQTVLIDPTPDDQALADQIQAMLDDITRKLRNENFIFK